MARRQSVPPVAPEPESVAVDFSDEALCAYHVSRDESTITCFASIRSSLGVDGYRSYLVGEIQRRAWCLPGKLYEVEDVRDVSDAVERLEYFVAALRKELTT